ncbi:hypothetical protein CLLU_15250 [Clostridium luticellarii]|jgi:hypothetical protein|uniref:Uncharacterized protein n=1 Tax=Clostridium luticellarii TaxID=1691940 RepID=A0A2T0BNK6_9CLOT|nr:hypothetical protein CLLU_15250 [Clostridium luticellarii]
MIKRILVKIKFESTIEFINFMISIVLLHVGKLKCRGMIDEKECI